MAGTPSKAATLLALLTDALLDGNLHPQAPEQRDRLQRAQELARELLADAQRSPCEHSVSTTYLRGEELVVLCHEVVVTTRGRGAGGGGSPLG